MHKYTIPSLVAIIAGGVGFFAGKGQTDPAMAAPPSSPGSVAVRNFSTESTPEKSNPEKSMGAAESTGRGSEKKKAAQLRRSREDAAKEMAQKVAGVSCEETLREWMSSSPDEVVEFMKDSPQRDMLLAAAFHGWAEKDAHTASAWLSRHPKAPGRDGMAAGLALKVAEEDFPAAREWLKSIKDPAMKLLTAKAAGGKAPSREDGLMLLSEMGIPVSAQEPIIAEWERASAAEARRNAQTIVSIHGAARAAGAALSGTTAEEITRQLIEGVTPATGAFAGNVFKISALTPQQTADALKSVQIQGGMMTFLPGNSE